MRIPSGSQKGSRSGRSPTTKGYRMSLSNLGHKREAGWSETPTASDGRSATLLGPLDEPAGCGYSDSPSSADGRGSPLLHEGSIIPGTNPHGNHIGAIS
jgi:hypothetical protein